MSFSRVSKRLACLSLAICLLTLYVLGSVSEASPPLASPRPAPLDPLVERVIAVQDWIADYEAFVSNETSLSV